MDFDFLSGVPSYIKKTPITQNKLYVAYVLLPYHGSIDNIHIGNDKIVFSKKVKNLGVYFDSSLCMEAQINHLCKSLNFELRKINQMSQFLNFNTTKQLGTSFMLSNLIIAMLF